MFIKMIIIINIFHFRHYQLAKLAGKSINDISSKLLASPKVVADLQSQVLN